MLTVDAMVEQGRREHVLRAIGASRTQTEDREYIAILEAEIDLTNAIFKEADRKGYISRPCGICRIVP